MFLLGFFCLGVVRDMPSSYGVMNARGRDFPHPMALTL